jgi:hypothetical protein
MKVNRSERRAKVSPAPVCLEPERVWLPKGRLTATARKTIKGRQLRLFGPEEILDKKGRRAVR